MSDRFVFGDFEFNNREVILGCFLDTEGSETTLDFRDGKNRDAIQNFIAAHADHIWVAYAAKAEMESLLRLGVDITPMRWIDLMAEATMITGRTARCGCRSRTYWTILTCSRSRTTGTASTRSACATSSYRAAPSVSRNGMRSCAIVGRT